MRLPARSLFPVAASVAVLAACSAGPRRGASRAAAAVPCFRIDAVDGASGRGVPLVELTTVHGVRYVTDSAGVAAILEPGLAGHEVWFHVKSHGYEVPADGFGSRGVRVRLTPGGARTVALQRNNIAERRYRVTGQGIYRDSALLGDPVPLAAPLLAGGVLGQDSVVNAVYRGRLYWFWGDTNRASYPLGNFATSGATSRLPGQGGLDPAVGVDLEYFVDPKSGFSRPMCPIAGPGPVWISGLMVLPRDGREVMLTHYSRMKDLGTRHEHGLALWNDGNSSFEKLAQWPLDTPLHPSGAAVRVGMAGEEWWLFPNPYPAVRVRDRWDDVVDPKRYEAFTCLEPGARFDARNPALERDAGGELVWAWKMDTAAVTPGQLEQMVQAGSIRRDEIPMGLRDIETGKPVVAHGGSICFNAHRGKWIMIALQAGGTSFLGEVWYAESQHIMGPWRDARRIVTHDRYSFYNVKQHPYFDQEGGRLIYFEGTYTATFSGNPDPTPRYDYNQIMYRLDLDDPRLGLGSR